MEIQPDSNSLQTYHESHTVDENQAKSVTNKDKHIKQFEQINGKVINLNSKEPSEKQLCDIIVLMKNSMEGRSLQKAIMMMHDFVVKKKPPQKVFCDYIPPMSHIPDAYRKYQYSPRNRQQIVIPYKKEEIQKKSFNSQLQQKKYKQKRQIAKSFISEGYNIQRARLMLSKFLKCQSNISHEAYKLIINSIITQSFRRLQNFLIQNCEIKIKPLGKQQLKRVISLIVEKQQLQITFRKFIRLVFGLSNITISQIEQVNFYLLLMKHMHKKRLSVEGLQMYYSGQNSSEQQSQTISIAAQSEAILQKNEVRQTETCDKSFTKSYQANIDKELIHAYKAFKSLTKSACVIAKKYPNWSPIQKIKNRFFYLLRITLFRVQQQSKNLSNFPKLHNLNDYQINKILRCCQSQALRFGLLQYYCKNEINKDDLFFLIEMTNDFSDLMKSHGENELQEVKSLQGGYEYRQKDQLQTKYSKYNGQSQK